MRRIVVAAIIAGIVLAIGLILLGLMGDFLVDWAWFSAVHYPGIFWTVVGATATLFFAAFLGSAALVGLNGLLAVQFSNRGIRVQPAAFDWRSVKAHNLSELLRLMPRHVSLLRLAVGLAFLLAILIAAIEVSNWDVALRFIYGVPHGHNDPLFGKEISFYLFSLPAYVALKNWMLLASGVLGPG